MGYPMAVNLRSKMGSDKTLLVCDVSEEAIAKFQKQLEGKGPIQVVKNGFEAVQQAVSANVMTSWRTTNQRLIRTPLLPCSLAAQQSKQSI